jgi:hypothetical protein
VGVAGGFGLLAALILVNAGPAWSSPRRFSNGLPEDLPGRQLGGVHPLQYPV